MRRLLPIVLTALIAACGGPPHGTPAGAAVTFDLAADPQNLNPLFLHQDAASVEQQVDRLQFEPFIDLDAAGREVPALLAVVPTRANGGISADGRTIVYRLRRGVRWSDGVPVTSRDVLFTLHAILDPRNPVASREGYDLIDRAVAVGPGTVRIHLKHAWAPAVATFFSYGFRPQFVLPAHVLAHQQPLAQAPFNGDPTVGDGPYLLQSWQRGDELVYRANPRYWRGEPFVRELDLRIIPDPSTNLVMLQSGGLDWNLIAPAQRAALRHDPSLRFERVPTAVVAGLAFNLTRPPLNDPRMRRAIAMSIDRNAISRKVTFGDYPVTNQLQPQFSWAYDPRIREPGYDPVRADRVLDALGWKRGPDGMRSRHGVALRFVYVQFPESTTGVRVATYIQAELHARGIGVELKSVSNAQLFLPRTGTLAAGAFDMAYVPFTMGADPDDSSVLMCGAPANFMRYCNPAVDALERQALTAPGRAERAALYRRIAQYVAHDVPILYLFNADYLYAYRATLHGFRPNAFLPTWNAYAWRKMP